MDDITKNALEKRTNSSSINIISTIFIIVVVVVVVVKGDNSPRKGQRLGRFIFLRLGLDLSNVRI